MPSDPFAIVGSVVDGRYRVERVAGQGGFGVVYRAHHLGFQSPIALKVLKLPQHWSFERIRARTAAFQREGRVLFELSMLDPSIVRAFETGTILAPEGKPAPYLALEWLNGVSLDHEIRYRRNHGHPRMTLREVLELVHAPAQGLARAHARGIAHRDIKPGNLFVSIRDGTPQVKILDFGIAKVIDEGADTTTQLALASGTTASFTPMYAAPEQWLTRLGATGTWTDVHGFALVCVELLTGEVPFRGKAASELMTACLAASARPTPGCRGLTLAPEVEAVFARAVALQPRDRFRDVGAFWQALCEAAAWSPAPSSGFVELASLPAAGESDTRQVDVFTATSLSVLVSGPSTTAATASLANAAGEPGQSLGSARSTRSWALLAMAAISLALLTTYMAARRPEPPLRSVELPPNAGRSLLPDVPVATVTLPAATSATAREEVAISRPVVPERKRPPTTPPHTAPRAHATLSDSPSAIPAGSGVPLAPQPSPRDPSPEVNIDDPALIRRK